MNSFSVIIPLYNGSTYIERAIQSILRQTLLPTEILVIDDGSTDDGPTLVEQQAYPLVRLIRQRNAGVSAARNKGMTESRADFLTFLDADDVWEKDHLEILSTLIDKYPQCGIYGTSYYLCKPGNTPTLPQLPAPYSFSGEDGVMDNYFVLSSGINPPLHMSSFCVRKEHLMAISGFPVGIPAGEDSITLARLYARCEIAYSCRPTSIYYLYPMEGKKPRPSLWYTPVDAQFDALLQEAKHRKGVRRYVSSWHKGRMAGALLSGQYKLALREFWIAFTLFPWQKKLYTALLAALYARHTRRSLYEINQSHRKPKNL